MTVVVHRLVPRRWAALPHVLEPIVAGLDDVGRDALVQACHGSGGFGSRLSVGGVADSLRSTDTRRVTTWHVARPDRGVAGAVGLAVTRAGNGLRFSIPVLLVGPGDRGRGLGAGLVREALRVAAVAGASEVTIETLASWPEAAAFWAAVARRLATTPSDADDR